MAGQSILDVSLAQTLYLLFGSIVPSLLALVFANHLSKRVNENRAQVFKVSKTGIRTSDRICGLHLNLTAFAIFPSILAFYQNFKVRIHVTDRLSVPIENQALVVFYTTVVLALSLYFVFRLSCKVDYGGGFLRGTVLALVINSLGGASLGLTLFFLLVGAKAIVGS